MLEAILIAEAVSQLEKHLHKIFHRHVSVPSSQVYMDETKDNLLIMLRQTIENVGILLSSLSVDSFEYGVHVMKHTDQRLKI